MKRVAWLLALLLALGGYGAALAQSFPGQYKPDFPGCFYATNPDLSEAATNPIYAVADWCFWRTATLTDPRWQRVLGDGSVVDQSAGELFWATWDDYVQDTGIHQLAVTLGMMVTQRAGDHWIIYDYSRTTFPWVCWKNQRLYGDREICEPNRAAAFWGLPAPAALGNWQPVDPGEDGQARPVVVPSNQIVCPEHIREQQPESCAPN